MIRMKKRVLLVISSIALLLSSCASGGHLNSRNNPIASLFNSNDSANYSSIVSGLTNSTSQNDYPVYESVDIDLTTMNATMVYSEVYDMLDKPSNYLNKIVKVAGPFRPYESTDPNSCYPAILVMDATACCGNGLEFLLYGVPRCSMSGGNGYPLYDEEATIVGRFETYLEGTDMYVHLIDAIWLK